VALGDLHELDHPPVRRIRQDRHTKAEHRTSPIAGRGTSIPPRKRPAQWPGPIS
jgi:hypothetical protein